MREAGLETPLLQYRLVKAWGEVVGEPYNLHSFAEEIRKDVLIVKVDSPSLMAEMQMRRSDFVGRLNKHVGAFLINDIRFVCE